MISTADMILYIDDAIDGMVEIVEQLGDEHANRTLPIDGSNSPFAVLTHCLGVMEFWGGYVVAGRRIRRDRDAEFVASGSVPELVERARAAQAQLVADLDGLDAFAPPRGDITGLDDGEVPWRTQGNAVVHIYEELAQHRGQMEITRDVLLAG